MISLPRENRPWFFLLLVSTAVVLIVMLYFGIRLKGFRPSNNVQWSASGNGLAFERFSQAYTESFFTGSGNGTGLTIELAIHPRYSRNSGTGILMMVHDGDDNSQLVIGQWRSSLIIMNGDDYSNQRRTPKIYFKLDRSRQEPYFLSIVSNKTGTSLFLDGAKKKSRKDLILRYPNRTARTRLVIGNNLNGSSSWAGTLMGLAFYDHGLENDVIVQHYEVWRMTRNFSSFKPQKPRLLYAFDEGRGERVTNKLGNGLDLIVPAWMKVLQPKALSWPKREVVERPSGVKDVVVNFTGFVPFGFLFIATFARLEGIRIRRALWIAVLASLLFSLSIEIAQMWIPSRNSSMLDLILNTLGGGMGALLFRMIPSRSSMS